MSMSVLCACDLVLPLSVEEIIFLDLLRITGSQSFTGDNRRSSLS